MTDPNDMTFIEHLKELRSRIIRMFLFAGLILVCCLPFTNYIYAFVSSPLMELMPPGSSMIATEVASPFLAPLRVTIYTALLISVPYFFIELWGFVSPGLYKREKAFVGPLILSSVALFYVGVVFAYFVVSPIILNFFISAAPDSIQVMTDINKYLDFVLKLFFAFGFAFEIPIATFLIITTGLISKDRIKSMRPYLIISFFVIGMFLTPPDIFSQLFLAIPMWLLFEVGLFISRDPKS
ncbi:twin-arginine translocase subunit TatC [Gammaproteobacteria bacterium]|nr:twin-arginine translocase subunit TatC [Gammaproteobacteria bacterium]